MSSGGRRAAAWCLRHSQGSENGERAGLHPRWRYLSAKTRVHGHIEVPELPQRAAGAPRSGEAPSEIIPR